MTKITTDVINGCVVVTEFDQDVKILDQDDFYVALSKHQDGIIGAEIDEEMYQKIDEEYGIH